jgi:hypothetical protein
MLKMYEVITYYHDVHGCIRTTFPLLFILL